MNRRTTTEYRVVYRRQFNEHRNSRIYQRRHDAERFVRFLQSPDSIAAHGEFAELRLECREVPTRWEILHSFDPDDRPVT